MAASTEKYRVQLDFTPEAFRELEALRAEVGATTRADAVRQAMRILRWTIDELKGGAKILVSRNGVLAEVVFPSFPKFKPAESNSIPKTEATEEPVTNEAAVDLKEILDELDPGYRVQDAGQREDILEMMQQAKVKRLLRAMGYTKATNNPTMRQSEGKSRS